MADASTSCENITFTKNDDGNKTTHNYNFSATVIVIKSDGSSDNVTMKGSFQMSKLNGIWLISHFYVSKRFEI